MWLHVLISKCFIEILLNILIWFVVYEIWHSNKITPCTHWFIIVFVWSSNSNSYRAYVLEWTPIHSSLTSFSHYEQKPKIKVYGSLYVSKKTNLFAANISKQIILQNTSDKNDKYEVETFPIARSIMFTSIQMITIQICHI